MLAIVADDHGTFILRNVSQFIESGWETLAILDFLRWATTMQDPPPETGWSQRRDLHFRDVRARLEQEGVQFVSQSIRR